jgi:hypothetical protein
MLGEFVQPIFRRAKALGKWRERHLSLRDAAPAQTFSVQRSRQAGQTLRPPFWNISLILVLTARGLVTIFPARFRN